MISFLQSLISLSASINHVSEQEMKARVKVMATGGGAHKYYDMLRSELGVRCRERTRWIASSPV